MNRQSKISCLSDNPKSVLIGMIKGSARLNRQSKIAHRKLLEFSIVALVLMMIYGARAQAHQPGKIFRIGFLDPSNASAMSVLFWLLANLLLIAVSSQAQQRAKTPKVGLLIPGSPAAYSSRVDAFKHDLRELTYIEGKNIAVEYRYAGENNRERLSALAEELVSLKVDLIVTSSSTALAAARKASNATAIIFASIRPDPVEAGLINSLARPGGNITGFTILAPELDGKRLEILHEAFPKATKLAFLRRMGVGGEVAFQQIEVSAKKLGLKLQPMVVNAVEDFNDAFAKAKKGRIQAIIVTPNPLFTNHIKDIIELATKNRLPGMYPIADFVELGGLMSYGPNTVDNWRRAATYVDKILNGAKAGDLPVQQPTKFEFIINLKSAKQIGLEIPQWTLMKADRVIK